VARLVTDYDLALDWRGFELHPETPRGGMPLSRLLPADRLPGMHAQLQRFAEGFGVSGMRPSMHLPNTRRALAVAERAREEGRLDAFRHAAMTAHWEEGRDLEDLEVLAALAVQVGMDAETARVAADDPVLQARIDAVRAESQRLGVPGIPTFVFGPPGQGARAVVGCQTFETLARVAEQAGARRR